MTRRLKIFMSILGLVIIASVGGVGYMKYNSYYGITKTTQSGAYTNIDVTQLKEMLGTGSKGDIKIVDLRRPDEWLKTGVVEGSLQITAFDKRGQLLENFTELFQSQTTPDDQVILICRSGNRSSVVAGAITDHMGYKNVYNVVGGISSWKRKGFPVAKSE